MLCAKTVISGILAYNVSDQILRTVEGIGSIVDFKIGFEDSSVGETRGVY